MKIFIDKLELSNNLKIIDYSFEVCLFRDFFKAGIFTRVNEEDRKRFEKQTFDNVFILSDGSIILIEAKANQKFSPAQITQMKEASVIIEDKSERCDKVYLVGLHSSKYHPKESTIKDFDATITWEELAVAVPSFKTIFNRANTIYND